MQDFGLNSACTPRRVAAIRLTGLKAPPFWLKPENNRGSIGFGFLALFSIPLLTASVEHPRIRVA